MMNYTVTPKALTKNEIQPEEIRLLADQTLFISFPRAAFGSLALEMPAKITQEEVVIHVGEKLTEEGRIDREPPGTIRYRQIKCLIPPGQSKYEVTIPADKRNTGPSAIPMPKELGEVLPFRYVEIEDAQKLGVQNVSQIAVWYPFDDTASSFHSSSKVLNAVWNICKYTIKATTFCGVYVDGDRERIPYEGDAYINQLGHYCTDQEYDFARFSHEYMLQNPTWPTEWHMHSVMMAWADYWYSGETKSLSMFYDTLKVKTLMDFARPDGLISVTTEQRTPVMEQRLKPHFEKGMIKENIRDLVDWPPGSFTEGGTGERDNHDMCPINTVPNAFHAHVLQRMSHIAAVLGKSKDQDFFANKAEQTRQSINRILFDGSKGRYIDGEGSNHSSLHSNMFMLAFDLVPQQNKRSVIDFIKSRGMACSVYGAQFLLEALYRNQEDDYALDLLQATHERSWWNMIQAGSTMTLEAWDIRFKNNLDWNHAWGAVPANIIPRFVLGVTPMEAGFKRVCIHPQPGNLTHCQGKVPTPHGSIEVRIENKPNQKFILEAKTPHDISTHIDIPARYRKQGTQIILNGKPYDTNAC